MSSSTCPNVTPRPAFVRFALWGVPGRSAASGFMWASFLAAAICGVASLWYPIVRPGWLMLFAGVWYWQAIRWVDKHEQW